MNLNDLNDAQRRAVVDSSKDTLVLAGAGTGKTRVLTARVEFLLEQGISPYDILCFTFTNKAARVMKWRIRENLGEEISDKLSISTFHSFMVPFVLENLKNKGYGDKIQIIGEKDSMYYINKVIDAKLPNFTNKELKIFISNLKNGVQIDIDNIEIQSQINECFEEYQSLLKKYSSIDLDDIVYYFHQSLISDNAFLEFMRGYKFIMVDECQDTNPIQYEILKLIRGNDNHLFMCGDDDQSIYAFRGADPFLVKRFIDEYNPNQIVLEMNYRSLPQVIMASTNIINNNINRVKKTYKAVKKRNALIEIISCNNNRHEGIQICSIINQFIEHGYEYKDIAVLFRNNIVAEHLVPYFLKYNIPHTKTRLNYLECEEIKLIINYYRFLIDPDNDLYLENLLQNRLFDINLNCMKQYSKKYNITLFQSIKLHDEMDTPTKYFLDKYYREKISKKRYS